MQLLGLAGVYNAGVLIESASFGWFWEPDKLVRVEDSVKIAVLEGRRYAVRRAEDSLGRRWGWTK